MKFVALALLLVVGELFIQNAMGKGKIKMNLVFWLFSPIFFFILGSQAASLQADAPSQLDQIRSAADVYMTQAKQGLIKALDQLDDSPYQELK